MTDLSSTSGKLLQARFFQKIKDTIPPNLSLVDEIADLLELSNDSVYRRIRGETSLTIDEIARISSHFNISFDIFSEIESAAVTFNYGFLRNEDNFKQYLLSILQDMKQFAESQAEEKQLIYSANNIPLFRYFNYPELAAFKIFYWLKFIMDVPALKDQKFTASIINQELLGICKDIYNAYTNIPSIEVWTDETIISHLKHIEFYWDAGYFVSKEDAIEICNQTRQVIEDIQNQAERSSKLNAEVQAKHENFKFYSSEIEIGNTTVLVKLGGLRSVYLGFHTFNTILTSNERFCEETEHWLNTVIKKSILLSGTSSKYRFRFFRKMNDKLEKAVDRIQNS